MSNQKKLEAIEEFDRDYPVIGETYNLVLSSGEVVKAMFLKGDMWRVVGPRHSEYFGRVYNDADTNYWRK
jgi:hypothetical protein